MANPLSWISDELKAWDDAGLFRRRLLVQPLPEAQLIPAQGGLLRIDGREVWDFASNNYLGLASEPTVVEAAIEATRRYGVGAKASPLVSGRTEIHAQLESALAEFEGTDAAILFPTGTAANIGTITALVRSEDTVFCDRWNHASLIDGCRLSGAKFRVFRHDDLPGLHAALSRETAQRIWLVTDSVFSMDGDLAPLPDLCEIAEQFGAAMILDEAHATGVWGQNGRGLAELQNVADRIAVRIGTLSKSIGALGGFVTGCQSLIDYLWNRARTQVYSTALPPALCAAAIAALAIIQRQPQRRKRLQANAQLFRDELARVNVTPLAGSTGPIVPIVLSDPREAVDVAVRLRDAGFLVGAIRPPTVPRGTSRLRVTLNSEVPQEMIVNLAAKIGELIPAHSQFHPAKV